MTLVALAQHPGADRIDIALAAPRANALEPGLLDALRHALDRAEGAAPGAILLSAGRNFCSGGDVARFLAAARRGEARAYALRLVPALQDIILRLLTFPATVAVAVRGAVTGGGAGFLFAADLAVAAPDAFVQPWYGPMGYAPDGGWTAVLPERIGAGPALSWLASNRRRDAAGIAALGLTEATDPAPESRAAALWAESDAAARRAARALIWDAARLARVQKRLEAETAAFLDLIDRPETRARMERFLAEPVAEG